MNVPLSDLSSSAERYVGNLLVSTRARARVRACTPRQSTSCMYRFGYLLLYLKSSAMLSNLNAGMVMMVGQYADAVATPLVGIFSDASKGWPGLHLGRRKLWHLMGTLIVLVCFSSIFVVPFHTSRVPYTVAYYASGAALFNVGWASVQVSHMAMVPELTPIDDERVCLNSWRYAAQVAANSSVYVLFLLSCLLTPDTDEAFHLLGIGVITIGTLFTIVFHVGTPNPPDVTSSFNDTTATVTWRHWLRSPLLYVVAVVYTSARVVVNISQVYLPFFVRDALGMGKTAIGAVPLVMFAASFLTSFLLGRLNAGLGRRRVFVAGAFATFLSIVAMSRLTSPMSAFVFPVAFALGAGNATIMVQAISMESDLVGTQDGSAFVFGALSFCDKLVNGVIIILIESRAIQTGDFIRVVFCGVPGLAVALASAVVLFVALPPPPGTDRAHDQDHSYVRIAEDSPSHRTPLVC